MSHSIWFRPVEARRSTASSPESTDGPCLLILGDPLDRAPLVDWTDDEAGSTMSSLVVTPGGQDDGFGDIILGDNDEGEAVEAAVSWGAAVAGIIAPSMSGRASEEVSMIWGAGKAADESVAEDARASSEELEPLVWGAKAKIEAAWWEGGKEREGWRSNLRALRAHSAFGEKKGVLGAQRSLPPMCDGRIVPAEADIWGAESADVGLKYPKFVPWKREKKKKRRQTVHQSLSGLHAVRGERNDAVRDALNSSRLSSMGAGPPLKAGGGVNSIRERRRSFWSADAPVGRLLSRIGRRIARLH